ncbi:tetratricopeptide repeat protein [Nonomuraea typhae]|uniref:Tetratricopeptide repeat protein n=1 Tax=Nonomuraea typhae TaxID=2603600 RepID=A0ABW7YRL2_9ACTN
MDGLCVTTDVDDGNHGRTAGRVRLQAALAQAVESALLRKAAHHSFLSHDMYLILPGDTRFLNAVPSLIREIQISLEETNSGADGQSRVRLRLALARGLVMPPGITGHAVAECLRLLDSEPVRAASRRGSGAGLTVVASDSFYQNVAALGLPDHRPEDYRRVRLGRGLPAVAWLYTPDRTGGGAAAADGIRPGDVGAGARAEEMAAQAGRLLELGAYRQASHDLEEALRLLPGPDGAEAEAPLLRLGDCHQRLGDLEAAAQTWSFLLHHRPLCAAACQRLGSLELQRGRTDLALIYLTEGLRIVRTRPDWSRDAKRVACALLLDLSQARSALGDGALADAFLNEAAQADPLSPLPLMSLAFRAARRRDVQSTRRLLGTALIRVSGADRKDFLREISAGAASWEGGDVIIRVLEENGLDPVTAHWVANYPRPPPT